MRKYFHEKEILMPTQTSEPLLDKNGNVINNRNHDIRLIFDPSMRVEDPFSSEFMAHMAGSPADHAGRFMIETGAEEITWGYGLNTRRIPTYGGEVVQILSTYADKMVIRGFCQNYNKQQEIYNYFKRYIGWTTGVSGKERRQGYLRFTYPARNWSFEIMVVDIGEMKMSRDTVVPMWALTAEIVSENDRYELGQARSDQWSSVLKTPMTRSGRKGGLIRSLGTDVDTAVKAAKTGTRFQNFNILDKVDPFKDFIDQFPDGKRGVIADNFKAMIASWATGDIDTLMYNPLEPPVRTADEIWKSNFGSEMAFAPGGGGGAAIGSTDPTDQIVWGKKIRVFGTTFGGAGDDSGIGYRGDTLGDNDTKKNWDSYAELSTNLINGPNNNYNALGNLPYMTPIKVTYKGKSLTLYKRDVGFGGPGIDQKRTGSGDDPKIDIWFVAANKLKFNGWDYLDIEIGSVKPGGGAVDGAPLSDNGRTAMRKIQNYIKQGRVVFTKDNDKEAIMNGTGIVVSQGPQTMGNRIQLSDKLLVCIAYILDSIDYNIGFASLVGDHTGPSPHTKGLAADLWYIKGIGLTDSSVKRETIQIMKLLLKLPKSSRPTKVIMGGNGQADPEVTQYEYDWKGGVGFQFAENSDHLDHIHIGFNTDV